MTDVVERAEGPDVSGYELPDRFRLEDGRVFLSGVQALSLIHI